MVVCQDLESKIEGSRGLIRNSTKEEQENKKPLEKSTIKLIPSQ